MNLEFKLTENFKLKEFVTSKFYDQKTQVKVIKQFREDIELHFNIQKLATNLQILRDELKEPIIINISYRPVFWEHKQGRSGNSKHTLGIAADIRTKSKEPKEIHKVIKKLIKDSKMSEGGLGLYNSFVHYDIRGTKARWK